MEHIIFQEAKTEFLQWSYRTSAGIAKVILNHQQETINICTKFSPNPFRIYLISEHLDYENPHSGHGILYIEVLFILWEPEIFPSIFKQSMDQNSRPTSWYCHL